MTLRDAITKQLIQMRRIKHCYHLEVDVEKVWRIDKTFHKDNFEQRHLSFFESNKYVNNLGYTKTK